MPEFIPPFRKKNVHALIKARKYAAMGLTLVESSPYQTEIDQLRKKGKTAWAIAKELRRKYPDKNIPSEPAIRTYFRKATAGTIYKDIYSGSKTKELAKQVNVSLQEAITEISFYLQQLKVWRERTLIEQSEEVLHGKTFYTRNAAIEVYITGMKELLNLMRGFGLLWEQGSGKMEEEETTTTVDLKDDIATIIKMARRVNIPISSQGNNQATDSGQSP